MSGAVSETITREGGLLLLFIGFGVLLMVSYDVLRIFRQIVPHGTILLAVEDVLYWFICAILVFAMLYRENEGLLRWFVLAGIALGMMGENYFLSPYLVKWISALLKWIIGIFARIFRIFIKPFRITAKKGKKICSFFQKRLKKMGKAIKISISKL